jgi:uncharacterized lipoprotein YmbA
MTRNRRFIVTLILAAAALTGCGSSPTPRFYTLSAPEQPTAKADYSVSVGPVSVPNIVDRPQFVLRNAANQVLIAEQSRWADSLRSEIPRVIAANLAHSLGDAYVSTYPQGTGIDADYVVVIDIQRFESAPGEGATVEALWVVRPKAKGAAQRSGRSLVRETAPGKDNDKDYDALVAAHGRALASISRDIAEVIRAARAEP